LHFTSELIDLIQARGVDLTQVTLHVGAGTFQPLRVETLDAHKMHREYLEVSEAACNAIRNCRQKGVAS